MDNGADNTEYGVRSPRVQQDGSGLGPTQGRPADLKEALAPLFPLLPLLPSATERHAANQPVPRSWMLGSLLTFIEKASG